MITWIVFMMLCENLKKNQNEFLTDSLAEQMEKLSKKIRSVEAESERTKSLLDEERRRANLDTLTQLPNRSAYNERAFHELRRFKRYHRPLSLAVCDIDFFKRVNDKFGHRSGDKALKVIAKAICQNVRKVDFVARLGGEEFVLILPETTGEDAFKVLEKVRKYVASIPFKFKQDLIPITISFGITQFEADDSMESVFERADKALYMAKKSGRNRSQLQLRPRPKLVNADFKKKNHGISKDLSFK